MEAPSGTRSRRQSGKEPGRLYDAAVVGHGPRPRENAEETHGYSNSLLA